MDVSQLMKLELAMASAKKKFDAAEKKRADSVKALGKTTADKLNNAQRAVDKACAECRKAFDDYETAFRKFRDELTSK